MFDNKICINKVKDHVFMPINLLDFPAKWFIWCQKSQRNKINSLKTVRFNQSKITLLIKRTVTN